MATRSFKFTQKEIDALGVGKHSDGGGLYLYKGPKYSNWVYRFTMAGKRQEMGLGGFPGMTLKQAREQAALHANVLATGQNPKDTRDAQRTAEHHARIANSPEVLESGRLRTIAPLAFEARKNSLRGDGKAGRWYSPLRVHVLPALGAKHVSEIDGPTIAKALRSIWHSQPDVARKAITRLDICLRYARAARFETDRNAVADAREILGKQSHTAVNIPSMPWQDVPAFYATLGETTVELALRLLILTGARSKSVRFAHESQFDHNTWIIPAELMKGKKGQTTDFSVSLTDGSRRVIEAAKARDGFLFPGVRKGVISDMSMTALMRRAGHNARPHGFRSSFRKWADECTSAPYEVKEMAIAHVVGGQTERAYTRPIFEEKRAELLGQWSRFVTELGSTGEGKIVSLIK